MNILPDLSSHMRQLMRLVPHPVAVITASFQSVPDPHTPPESTFRGMTVSSFNTVTLSPKPLVSLNVRVPSETHSAMAGGGSFLAHVLSANTAGARIADAFTKGNNAGGEAFRGLVAGGPADPRSVEVYAGKGTQGAPLISGSGVMRVLRCRLLPGKEIDVEDHKVLVAEVLGIVSAPGKPSRAHSNAEAGSGEIMALAYCDRHYRHVGPEIRINEKASGSQSQRVDHGPVDIQKTMGLNVRRGDEKQVG